WVPYEERVNWLLDADCAVSAHLDHVETRFAFRTRLLDCFWAGLPVVCTEGDDLAERVARDDLGGTVAAGDVDGMAAAPGRGAGPGAGARARPLRAATRRGRARLRVGQRHGPAGGRRDVGRATTTAGRGRARAPRRCRTRRRLPGRPRDAQQGRALGMARGPGDVNAQTLRLSVVVVAYNSAASLPALLDALGAQTAAGDEAIV